jgi:hypothetical protein
MFKQWKLNRERKNDILLYQSYLLMTLSDIVYDFKQSLDANKQVEDKAKKSGITEDDALKILNNIKNLDQSEFASKIVEFAKNKETVAKNETVGK